METIKTVAKNAFASIAILVIGVYFLYGVAIPLFVSAVNYFYGGHR